MKNTKIFLIVIGTFFVFFVFIKFSLYKDEPDPKIVVVDIPVKESTNQDLNQEVEQDKDKEKETSSSIEAIVEWQGREPYPLDWSNTVPELKVAVNDFEKKWGQPLRVIQVYRPLEYMHHMRSVWEVWRFVNGKSYTQGYKCEDYTHIDTESIGKLNQLQKDYLNKEAKIHSFLGGDTPPGCVSDHAKGIAIDIAPPSNKEEYERFMNVAYSVGLCHYIKGDEPHFGLTSQLPEGTDCFVK